MSGWPFRFVHASDFHLELPLFGVAAVPTHLREVFLEAPFQAARRVFDTVLAEEAEFLVLSGDLLSPADAGPRGVLFLLAQFERLAQRQIPIYWASGRVDVSDAWPSAAALPSNVHVFSRGRAVEFLYERQKQPLARLIGSSRHQKGKIRGDDFFLDPGELFSIAVAHGDTDAPSLSNQGIDYWALGGEHQSQALYAGSPGACYCGSPQGRQPAEPGPHGCLLVHVDDRRTARTTLVETDTVRWCDERLAFDAATRRDDLETRMRDRLAALRTTSPHAHLLVTWVLSGSGPLLGALRHGGLADELLSGLRAVPASADSSHAEPAAWSVEISTEPAAPLPAKWYEEDTLLGEFLRRTRHLEENSGERIELERLLSQPQLAGTVASVVDLGEPEVRGRVLRKAALLGADLLRGDEQPAARSQAAR